MTYMSHKAVAAAFLPGLSLRTASCRSSERVSLPKSVSDGGSLWEPFAASSALSVLAAIPDSRTVRDAVSAWPMYRARLEWAGKWLFGLSILQSCEFSF